MLRFRKYALPFALVGLLAVRVGVGLTADDPKPATPAPAAKDAKPADLSALRDAVDRAAKRGGNVDEISSALAALEKSSPKAQAGRVSPELQALRDAVDDAARKGENVVGIAKELEAVEVAIAGKSLAKHRPQPKPEPEPEMPRRFGGGFAPGAFPGVEPLPLAGAGIDPALLNKAMELRRKAWEMQLQNPRDPEKQKEAQKMLAEANDLILQAMRKFGGGRAAPVMPVVPDLGRFPDLGRVPERPRLGIRMERVPAIAADQLGLDPNAGIAVSAVMPDSAAEKAGLKAHDIILEFAGKPVTDNLDDFVQRVNDVKAGEKINIVVLRKGKKVDVKGVELPEAAQQQDLPQLKLVPAPGGLPERPARPLPMNPLRKGITSAPAIPAGFESVSYTTRNGDFTLKGAKGGVKYVLTGTLDAAGRPKVAQITVEADGKTRTAPALDKLTGEDKTDVEKLLKSVDPRE